MSASGEMLASGSKPTKDYYGLDENARRAVVWGSSTRALNLLVNAGNNEHRCFPVGHTSRRVDAVYPSFRVIELEFPDTVIRCTVMENQSRANRIPRTRRKRRISLYFGRRPCDPPDRAAHTLTYRTGSTVNRVRPRFSIFFHSRTPSHLHRFSTYPPPPHVFHDIIFFACDLISMTVNRITNKEKSSFSHYNEY